MRSRITIAPTEFIFRCGRDFGSCRYFGKRLAQQSADPFIVLLYKLQSSRELRVAQMLRSDRLPGKQFRVQGIEHMPTDSHRKASSRLPSDERRQAIIDAVKFVFAKKGFDRTTSRDLAKAARVSEALVYKYFPTKLSLYNAMLDACAETPAPLLSNRIQRLEPCTETLIMMVDSLMAEIVESRSAYFDGAVLGRLAARSLLEDGEFIRAMLKAFTNNWVVTFERCLKRAGADGDLRELAAPLALRAWLVHHIAFGLMLHLCPKNPAVDYSVPKQRLITEAVQFALRGVGVKQEAINRYYSLGSRW
jgi:AcrR family transcriptional regulator